MNIVFWFCIPLLAFLLWVALACLFQPLGKLILKVKKYVERNITDTNKEEKENEDE